MSEEHHDEAARILFETMPDRQREALLDIAARALSKTGVDDPPRELLEEVALRQCRREIKDAAARFGEWVTFEEYERIALEEFERLLGQHFPGAPDKAVPVDALDEAVLKRLKEKYPQIWR